MNGESESSTKPPLSPETVGMLRRDHEVGKHEQPHPDCQLCPPRPKGRRPKAIKRVP